MSVAEKTVQALNVIKRLDLNNIVSVTTDQIGPPKIQVNNISDLKGLELSEEVFQDGCKRISTVVDGVLVFGVMLSERYLASAPF
ncbi:hypothetical protein NSQ62_11830 [Solibacillus sp. FSL H8-0523]|uniref:hypothetical protein n=1 Tax=Solibacillus sp. FSL H8-0523 TaxID=2954511 RepID=UPI00310103F6